MLRIYTLTLPLIYDSYNFDPIQKDTQFLMGLDKDIVFSEKASAVTEEIKGKNVFTIIPIWNITIHCPCHMKENILPEREFTITISGVTAHSKQEACQLLLPMLHRTCRSLSMMMNESNCNKHLFQPRIEPDFRRGMWKDTPCEAYKEAAGQNEGTREYIDENGTHVIEMYASASIAAEVSCETTIYGTLRADDFRKYYDKVNDAADFLTDEYYVALGSENQKSKFFHLFSIIEFIEREYRYLAGASHIFDKEDIALVENAVHKAFSADKNKRERAKSAVCQKMSQTTDIGRDEKLVNILHSMGIVEFGAGTGKIPVDRGHMSAITKKRNTFFHGSLSREKGQITVEEAVTWLMYICPEIIRYVMENPPAGV